MSLRLMHRFFIGLCLVLFAFTTYWSCGRNPLGLVTPWLIYASVAASLMTLGYLIWHLRTAHLPR